MPSPRSDAQVHASRLNGSQSHGPTSAAGKERSSRNRAAHGLTGEALVLPGETVAAYRRCQSGWFAALNPTTHAEAEVVQRLADVAWRLDRCARLEHRQHLAAVEHEMQTREEVKNVALMTRALQPINLLVTYCETAAGADPFVGSWANLGSLIEAAKGTVTIARDVGELPFAWIEALDAAIRHVEHVAMIDVAEPADLLDVVGKARPIQQALADSLSNAESAMTRLREEIAAITVPDEKPCKTLVRYRAELEKSQGRLLEILKNLRDEVNRAKSAQEDTGATPMRFRLRVVR